MTHGKPYVTLGESKGAVRWELQERHGRAAIPIDEIDGMSMSFATVLAMQRLRVHAPLLYVIPGIVAWLGIYNAGIHPTIAGVALGLLTPMLGVVAGIGFTMALFVAQLAFTDETLLAAAKLGILIASALAATLSVIIGRLLLAKHPD